MSGSVSVAEAYFISAYNMNIEDYFKDMDDNYIGNAYIHPSYFICSNGVTLDEATGVLNVPGEYSYKNDTMTLDAYHTWDGTGSEAQVTGEAGDIHYNEDCTDGGIVYGDGNVYYLNYASLSEYEKMVITLNEGSEFPRLLFNRMTNEGATFEINGWTNQEYVTRSDDGLICTINLAMIKQNQGVVNLNAIKAFWGQTVNVKSIQLTAQNSLKSPAKILLSVPFEGFNMSDITVVTLDNEEDGDCIWRNVYGYLDYDKQGRVHKGTNADIYLGGSDENPHDVRTLYVSRYNADFAADLLDNTYISKINNIYWETNFSATDNPIGTMTVNDICFTKNHVVARNGGNHTKLSGDLFFKYNENNTLVLNNEGKPYTGDGLAFTMNQGGNCVFGSSLGIFRELYADLSKFYKMQISGTPDTELVFIFNLDNTYENGNFDQIFAINDIDNSNKIFVRLDANGLANIDIKDFAKRTNNGKFHLNYIAGNNNSNVSIKYIKLYGTEDGVVEFNQDMYHTWNRAENGTVTRKKAFGSNYINKIGKDQYGNPQPVNSSQNQNVIFGHNFTFVKEDYAELTGYKAIKVTGTPGMVIRVIYNCTKNREKDGVGDDNCIIKEKNLTIGADGVGTLDIRDYVYFHLHGMKVGSGEGTIDKVELISDERVDYVLEGNGTLSMKPADVLAYGAGGKNANIGTCAIDAIHDVGARVIDARPRVSTRGTCLPCQT